MNKKMYISPAINIHTMAADEDLCAISGMKDTLSPEVTITTDDAMLSRRHTSVWGEDDEEDYE